MNKVSLVCNSSYYLHLLNYRSLSFRISQFISVLRGGIYFLYITYSKLLYYSKLNDIIIYHFQSEEGVFGFYLINLNFSFKIVFVFLVSLTNLKFEDYLNDQLIIYYLYHKNY